MKVTWFCYDSQARKEPDSTSSDLTFSKSPSLIFRWILVPFTYPKHVLFWIHKLFAHHTNSFEHFTTFYNTDIISPDSCYTVVTLQIIYFNGIWMRCLGFFLFISKILINFAAILKYHFINRLDFTLFSIDWLIINRLYVTVGHDLTVSAKGFFIIIKLGLNNKFNH